MHTTSTTTLGPPTQGGLAQVRQAGHPAVLGEQTGGGGGKQPGVPGMHTQGGWPGIPQLLHAGVLAVPHTGQGGWPA